MPIAALPPSTAQAIGSNSTLPDPCAVVKELLDNGLDAAATSITVEISQNTIDTIQVKDNGHGISSDDFAYVCKRAYTSKIYTLDDLRNVGGQSLGFRGEALASAAEMADSLTVTTRTKVEVVGYTLKYDSKGNLISTGKTSHPVGTTVCLTGFLRSIPIRRQTTIKNATKTVVKIRNLLQAYAIARPCTRISFKVLKSKSDKDNWTYAPSTDANIIDAARKVAGIEVAGQCFCKSWPDEEHYDADNSISLVAFLPKPDADFSKVSGCGQYISVDGRPLTSARGTPKEIVRLYKSYMRSASNANHHSTISDPFLCLQITCPNGSYDANVEPSKDDVLFAEREHLMALAEGLFKEVYGELNVEDKTTSETVTEASNFSLLMRKPAVQPPMSPPATNPRVSSARENAWASITPQRDSSSASEERAGSSEINDAREPASSNMNPWTIAKTHFFHRSSDSTRTSNLLTPVRHDRGRKENAPRVDNTQLNLSTVPSPDSHASSPQQRRGSRSSDTSESTETRQGRRVYTKGSRERDRERYGNGSLDTWFSKQTQPVLSVNRMEQSDHDEAESVMLDDLDTDDLFEPSSTTINKPFNLPLSHSGRSSRAPDLFCRQLSNPEERPSDAERRERRQEFPVMEEWSSRLHQASPDLNQTQDDLFDSQETEMALDFERRKREATIARRKQLQNGQLSLTPASSQSKSPHQNRYLAARAALSTSTQQWDQIDSLPHEREIPSVSEPRLADSDPRAYLMRVNTDLANSGSTKAKRTPTNRLPFERIPEGFDNHSLALRFCFPSWPDLSHEFRLIREVDSYVSSGDGYNAFSQVDDSNFTETCKIWENKICVLVKEKYRLRDVDLYGAEGGSDEAHLRNVDIYAAIQGRSISEI